MTIPIHRPHNRKMLLFWCGFRHLHNHWCHLGWNILDFLIVVLGIVSLFVDGSFTSLRAVRVLRPLRAITKIGELKVLVLIVIRALPRLLDVIMLLFFIFLVFGIVGINIFSGILSTRWVWKGGCL
jgi:hypothetical protein